ncbi:MAG TPA: glycosyltransferase family 4 protein [Polyangiaceae bacterium]|jgi:glycosyltransferase involved in cell wall biosynthesis|nr:glycosyltransferase family 4 protein [Polyangiaceae bacterium]
MMSSRPIAYVMEQTLGSITHYLNLRRQEPMPESGTRRWMPIDYRDGKVPWTLTGSLLARRALGQVLDDVDGIFMHTTTLALLSMDYFGKKPTVLSSDGTPMNKRGMRQAYGLPPESRLAEDAKRALFRRVFARASGFVAWSQWTKQSFVEDYGCREEDVVVIPPGIDLDQFTPGNRNHELPRILFVGGDFARKGGDLLLKVFRQRLRGKAELELVTRTDLPEEPGVRVYRNVQANSDELRALYGSSDVFALPTRADCYSLVCMEALASGLPIVATRIGGIPDMVREGQTGHVVSVDDERALGDALESLVERPEQRHVMSLSCREEARQRFESRVNARALFDFVRARC